MFEEMFQYLDSYFQMHGGNDCGLKNQSFRLRTEHTRRVFAWLGHLIEENPPAAIRKEELFTACIFHDIGYTLGKENHAKHSSVIFREYAKENGFGSEQTDYICHLIAAHSDKERLGESDTPYELVLLMEADMLDEEGALSILLDAMAEGKRAKCSYKGVYERLQKYPVKILEYNPMVTSAGKRFWQEKQELVQLFMKHLNRDLDGSIRISDQKENHRMD